MLSKQFRNGTQSFVHLLGGLKLACHVGFEDNDISTFGILRGVLAPHTFAEVIFWPHPVLGFRLLPSNLFPHNSSVQSVSLDGR